MYYIKIISDIITYNIFTNSVSNERVEHVEEKIKCIATFVFKVNYVVGISAEQKTTLY